MDNTKPDQKLTKIIKNPPELNDKQKAFLLLRENGESVVSACNTLGYNKDYGRQLQSKLTKYHIKDNNKMLKSASQALKKIIKGQTFGEIKEIKDSTALSAAKMVYDRIEPVVNYSENKTVKLIGLIDLKEIA